MRRAVTGCMVAGLLLTSQDGFAKDELLEVMAQKGLLTLEEYQKLKAQRTATEANLNTESGYKFSSADGRFSFQPGTLQQLDAAFYANDKASLSTGTELRRSRLSAAGVMYTDWQYRVEYEFSGSVGVTDAFVTYNQMKPVWVTLGQFKQPMGMDALSADKGLPFTERALPFAFIPARAPGGAIGSSGAGWSAQAGLFGEPVSNARASDEGYGVVGRVTFAPWLETDRVVHLGLGSTWRQPTGGNSTNAAGPKFTTVRFSSKPESNVLSQRFIDTGEIRNVNQYVVGGLEIATQAGAVSMQGEYLLTQVDRKAASTLTFSGWYLQTAYTLTGEIRPYKVEKGTFDGLTPKRPFGAEGWGAFEVAARWSGMDLSDKTVIGGREQNATLALNWTLNPALRISSNLVKVLEVDGGAFDGDEPLMLQFRTQLLF